MPRALGYRAFRAGRLLLVSMALSGVFLVGCVSDTAGFRFISVLFLSASRMSTTGFAAGASFSAGAGPACAAFFAIIV